MTPDFAPSKMTASLLAAVILSLQVLTTLPLGSLGVRISLADLFLPWLLGAIVWSAGQNRQAVPPHEIALPLLIWTGWLGVSLISGRVGIGHWEAWAVVNRGLGWLMLLGFFAAGWFGMRFFPRWFEGRAMGLLFVGAWIGIVISAVVMLMIRFRFYGVASVNEPDANALEQMLGFVTGGSRFQGFFVNPNAFGFFLAVIIALQIPFFLSRRIFSRRVEILGLAVSIFGLVFTFSRGAWAGAAAGVVLLAVMRRLDYRGLTVSGTIALALSLVWSIVLTYGSSGTTFTAVDVLRPLGALQDHSVSHRWVLTVQAVELWESHKIFGLGIGSFIAIHAGNPGDSPSGIHNSYLWLLTETGVLGLALAIAFFGLVLRRFLAAARAAPSAYVAAGGGAVVVVFAVVALAMEALYQRHLWFLLGAALAASACRSPHDPERNRAN